MKACPAQRKHNILNQCILSTYVETLMSKSVSDTDSKGQRTFTLWHTVLATAKGKVQKYTETEDSWRCFFFFNINKSSFTLQKSYPILPTFLSQNASMVHYVHFYSLCNTSDILASVWHILVMAEQAQIKLAISQKPLSPTF